MFKSVKHKHQHTDSNCRCSFSTHRGDPSKTLTLRNKFASEMGRRFLKLRSEIRVSIDTNDALGLRTNTPLPPGQFAFATDPGKVDGFMEWLEGNTNLEVLGNRSGRRVAGATAWTDTYISSAYQKGLQRSYTELKAAGYAVPPGGATAFAQTAFWQPIHADAVGLLYTRTFRELKGITGEMETAMSRSLAESLAEGRGPHQTARILMNRIEKVGDLSLVDSRGRFIPSLRRARMLARTEIIRAHHVAAVNSYREAGVVGVKVKAEWRTAGDDRVCPDCAPYEGIIFTLDEVESMIPVHPLCRCVILPAGVGEVRKEREEQADVTRERLGQPPLKAPKAPAAKKPTAAPKKTTRKRGTPKKTIADLSLVGARNVSVAFKKTVQASLKKIPKKVRTRLAKEGANVHVGKKLTNIRPDLIGEHPSGWPSGTTWNNAEACGPNAFQRSVWLAEEFMPIGEQTFEKALRTQYVLGHELGHSWNSTLGTETWRKFTSNDEFIKAWATDVANLPASKKPALQYFIQKGSPGRGAEETFAEIFEELTVNSQTGSQLELWGYKDTMVDLFPECAELVKGTM